MHSHEPSDCRTDLIHRYLSGGVTAAQRAASITYLDAAPWTHALQPEVAPGKLLAPFPACQQARSRAEEVAPPRLIAAGLAQEVHSPPSRPRFTARVLARKRPGEHHERMFAPIVILVLATVFVLAACRNGAQGTDYVEGELLVKFRAGVPEERMAEIHRNLGSRLAESWPAIRWYRVLLKEGLSVSEGIRQYRSLPEVEDVEPNFRIRLGPPPQDPPGRLSQ